MFLFGKGVSNKGFKTNKMIQSASTLTESTPYIGQEFIGFKKSYKASIDHPFHGFTHATG
jgi:hypothetical protein